MRPKAKKRILKIFEAILVLVFSQLPFVPPSSGALYNWPGGLSQNDGSFSDATLTNWKTADIGWILGASVADYLTNTKTHIMPWKVESLNFPGDLGTRTGATGNIGGSLKDITNPVAAFAPIPDVAWLFASGVLGLFVSRRRKPKA